MKKPGHTYNPTISLTRSKGSILLRCSVCGPMHPNQEVLEVDLHTVIIHLCRRCEALFMERMLTNYVKRTKKRAVDGKPPDYVILKGCEG